MEQQEEEQEEEQEESAVAKAGMCGASPEQRDLHPTALLDQRRRTAVYLLHPVAALRHLRRRITGITRSVGPPLHRLACACFPRD